MTVLQRYFASEIIRSVLFVLLAFLALFAFFDMMGELQDVGHGGYQLQHALLYVTMGLPGYTYELMPIAALIGTIWTLAQFAARSEFTIMRVSSMSTLMVGAMLAKIGLFFVLITFLFGEVISPITTEMAESLKLRVQGTALSQEFRSGLWAKDVIKTNGLSGEVVGSRFLNVKSVRPDGELEGVKLYEFDRDFHMSAMISAVRGHYRGSSIWELNDVSETRFSDTIFDQVTSSKDVAAGITTRKIATKDLISEITPEILSVLFAKPERMSAYDLSRYAKHLAENNQRTDRYEIAFWKKVIYPFAVFVMMALALPFAYMHVRAGGVSLKIFTGVMIGVSFQLLNSLFSHVGLLNTWPPLATAIAPSLLFLLAAIAALMWVERH